MGNNYITVAYSAFILAVIVQYIVRKLTGKGTKKWIPDIVDFILIAVILVIAGFRTKYYRFFASMVIVLAAVAHFTLVTVKENRINRYPNAIEAIIAGAAFILVMITIFARRSAKQKSSRISNRK